MGLLTTPRSSLVAYFMAGALALVAVSVSCGGGETSTAGGSAAVASTAATGAAGAVGGDRNAGAAGEGELRDALLGVPRR